MRNTYKKIGALVMVAGIAFGSQTFAAQYDPYTGEKPEFDDEVALPEQAYDYTLDDAEYVINVYNKQIFLDREAKEKYDMNKDGVVNATDASIIMDLFN